NQQGAYDGVVGGKTRRWKVRVVADLEREQLGPARATIHALERGITPCSVESSRVNGINRQHTNIDAREAGIGRIPTRAAIRALVNGPIGAGISKIAGIDY